MDSLIMVKGIKAIYQDSQKRAIKAVDGVTLSVAEGETLGLVGESGSGKTTLGKVVAGLIAPNRGHMYFKGKRVSPELRQEIQMVFQDSASALNPRLNVGSLIEEGLLLQKTGNKTKRREKVLAMLHEVGLQEEILARHPHQLSGGQRQRVALARSLLVLPELLILDEPVSALDVTAGARLLALLDKLQEGYGTAYLFISHNLAAVRQLCNRVAVMYLGKIVEYGCVEDVYVTPAHPYTRMLLAAHPHPDPLSKITAVACGEPANPFKPPVGCRYHPRCPTAVRSCRQKTPLPVEIQKGHFVACHKVCL